MNYFGFIKEHDSYEYAKSIKDLIIEGSEPNPYLNDIIAHLKKGKLCVPLMGAVEDAMHPQFDDDDFFDNEIMGYISVYTDGKWFWPHYLIRYLEKYPHIKIEDSFVQHVKSNKTKVVEDSKLPALEKEFLRTSWR
jgi:hypothetical protein